MSIYFDAPVGTKNELEQALRLNEKVLRTHTMRPQSIVDEVRTPHRRLQLHRPSVLNFPLTAPQVLSSKPSNPWNRAAGVAVQKKAPKKKKLKYGLTHEILEGDQKELAEFVEKYF